MFNRKSEAEDSDDKQIQRLKNLACGIPDLDRIATALNSPSLTVRTEAAKLLGQVGDASSLPPLKEALLKCYSARSPRWHRFLGILETSGVFAILFVLFGALLIALIASCSCIFPFVGGGSAPNVFEFWDSLSEHRRKNDPFVRAVLNSIEQLVEKHSAIELRPLLPALRTIAADSHHHRGDTRTAALNAISSIEAVACEVGDLPISSRAQPAGAHDLPVVEGTQPDQQNS